MELQIFEIFPTPILKFNIGRDFTKEEIEFILDKPLFDVDLRENLLFNTEPSLLFKTEPDSSSFDNEN